MGITRQGRQGRSRRSDRRKERRIKNSQYIIKTKKNILTETIIYILSVLAWLYVILAVWMFVGGVIGVNNEEMRILKAILKIDNNGIRHFVLVASLAFIIFSLGLWIWRTYNYKRYGKLRRRTYPPDTTRSDILDLGLMSEVMIYKLQNNKVVILETNPVVDI